MAVTREQILARINERKKAKKAPVVSERAKPKTVKTVTETRQARGPRTIKEDIQRRVKDMDKFNMNMYKVLSENMVKAVSILTEATQAGPAVYGVTGQGAGVGLMKTYFDIFFGYFPNLIATELASTQPIKTEKAMVFYYETVAGSDKGNVQKGDALITPFKINTDVNFSSDMVNLPRVAVGNLTFDTDHNNYDSGAIAIWGPFVARSLQLKNADGSYASLAWSSDTAFTGSFVDGAGTTVAITNGVVTAGASTVQVTMTFAATADGWAPSGREDGILAYAYDNKYAPTEVPEINANIDSRDITAKPRTIKANYSFQAGFGFEAQFGVKLEDKLAEAAMFELKRETDLDFVFEIMRSAPAQIVWNKAAGVANGMYEMHKLSFQDAVIAASNHIFGISKRVRGNILVVGLNAQTIVETLPGYKGAEFGSQLGGPTVIGKLGSNMKVIAIPDLDADDWLVLYKNDQDNLDAGIIFAPYIPVVATTPVTLDDFVIRRAFTMSYGKLVTNADYFVKGRIINEPMAMPMYLVSKDGTDTNLGTIGTDAYAPSIPSVQ